jgi:hypothetical protein
MGLLDTNYQDQRLTASQKKKIKPAIQGGGYNYLGEQEEVTVPRKWLSDPDHVVAELAYITPREKKVLIDLNMYGSLDGKPNNAPGGLPSLQGDMGSVGGGGNTGNGGGDGNRESYGSTGQYGKTKNTSTNTSNNGGDVREQYGAVGQYQKPSVTPTGGDNIREQYLTTQYPTLTQAEIEKGITDKGEIIDEKVQKESLVEKALDLYQKYSPLGMVMNLGSSLLDTLGTTSKSLQNKVIAFDLQNKLEKAYQDPTFDPFTPDASVTQLEQDLARAKAGEYSQQEYQDTYAPQMNQIGATTGGDGGERAVQTALTPYAPYAITGTTPQQSVVQDYFSGLNLGQAISSGLQTDYNNAKNNINSILGITPVSQQFGYSTQPYGLLSNTNMAANPFNIDYLRTRGLI